MGRNRKRKKNGVAVRAPGAPQTYSPPPPTHQRVVRASRTELYAGAVPHPDHARSFEEIQPGSFDRFLSIAERQSKHRQVLEQRFMSFNGWSQVIGVVFAGLIVLAGIASGTFLLYNDKQTQGLTAMFAPLALVAGTFIVTKSSEKREKARKAVAEQQ